jgi:hypothetical protein
MAILQRQPFEVNGEPGNPQQNDQVLYKATDKLLRAGNGLFPFTGAVIRHAVSQDDVDRQIAADNVAEQPATDSILGPVRRATANWWTHHPASQHIALRNLHYHHNSTLATMAGHIDQYIRKDGIPDDGPISALLALRGTVSYYLSVIKADVFSPRGAKIVRMHGEDETVMLGHRVELEPTDLLLFTNIPPTRHETYADPDRITAIHFTKLYPKPEE